MKKGSTVLLFLWVPILVLAQWHVGIIGGIDYNAYSAETHYMKDWKYKGAAGCTAGLMGQYNFKDWLGLRMELNWIQKNHSLNGPHIITQTGKVIQHISLASKNDYVQVPIMAALSFGNKKWRGIFNVGGFGGKWVSKRLNGIATGLRINDESAVEFGPKDWQYKSFVDERDQRFEFGLLVGGGAEWRFSDYWACQVEGRYYYSTTSTQKNYMRIKNPQYNTTYSFHLTACYIF